MLNLISVVGIVNLGPVNAVPPAVTGTEIVGSVLTATTGTWTSDSDNAYTYRWCQAYPLGGSFVISAGRVLGVPISGATSSTYTLQSGDLAQSIFCEVKATSANGVTVAQSNATGLIAGGVGYLPYGLLPVYMG